MKILRVIRGILGTAAAWSIAWIPLTIATWSVTAALGGQLPPMRVWGAILVGAAIRGFITGGAFATVLAIVGRRRTFASLKIRNMALWGALGGLVAPLIGYGALVLNTSLSIPPIAIGVGLGMSSVVGAISAIGTLLIARRAPELRANDVALLDVSADNGLTGVAAGGGAAVRVEAR